VKSINFSKVITLQRLFKFPEFQTLAQIIVSLTAENYIK